MKEELRPIIVIFVILFIGGGLSAVFQGIGVLLEVFAGFFPIFYAAAKKSLEDYLTSPYFIVGVIMSIASAFGIWFGAKGGKRLYLIVSIICEVISLVSILSNIL